jgi:hypothetical protein
MGLSIDLIEFLLAVQAGRKLGDVLTLGRQQLLCSEVQLRALASRYGMTVGQEADKYAAPNFADALFRDLLGASSVTSLDRAGFEGAGFLHDLNVPVPCDRFETFDTVIDGGTLEHIFNFPTALANVMRMVRVEGRLIIFTPANNLCGHGLYQFSPELFFRVFAAENGYRLERLTLLTHPYPSVEVGTHHRWYDVADPAVVGSRVLLSSSECGTLMVAARRESAIAPFATVPQQSDYVSRWAQAGSVNADRVPRARHLTRVARQAFQRLMKWPFLRGRIELHRSSLKNSRAFRRVR